MFKRGLLTTFMLLMFFILRRRDASANAFFLFCRRLAVQILLSLLLQQRKSCEGFGIARDGGVDRKMFVTHRMPRASWISCLLNYFKLRRRDASANAFFLSCRCPAVQILLSLPLQQRKSCEGFGVARGGGVDRKVFVTHRTPCASWISYLLNYFKLRRRDASANGLGCKNIGDSLAICG